MSVSLLVELRESKLRCAVNRDKQVKFAFFGAHFSDIDVEVADRVPLERLLAPCLALDRRKPADLVALKVTIASDAGWSLGGHKGNHRGATAYACGTQQRELPPRR
jgi:hypothetical protein